VLHVFSYYSKNPQDLFNMIEWVEGNILDLVSLEDAFEGAAKVFNVASYVSFNASDKKKILNININGTANVVNACLNMHVQKLCHVSSIAAIGSSSDGLPVTEELIWSPSKRRSYYSISKFHSEMEVWRGIEEGLHAVIVNPSVIIGPGFWNRGGSMIFEVIYKGMKYYPPGTTGYVDVRDVARIMVLLMDSNIAGERFILNSENLDYKNVFSHIANSLNVTRPTKELNSHIANLACKLEKIRSLVLCKKPRITSEAISIAFKQLNYSSDKIKQKLGNDFIQMKQSIIETAMLFLKDNYRKEEVD
jgi:nucleoside-diphosphate-sugar epimerase